MSRIILPPIALYNAEREKLTERHHHLKRFDVELKAIDWRLSLVKAAPGAVDRDLIPGYWHIKRDNSQQGVPDTYMPVKGPQGEFMEPHDGVLNLLRERDMGRPGAWEEMVRRMDREEEERQRRLAAGRADFREEFADRYKAKANPGVSFSNAKPWTYRAGVSRDR
jgi:hypothetical protein